MTETEELQKNVQESIRQQHLKELLAHLTVLGDNVDRELKRQRWTGFVWLAGWIFWVSTSFIDWYFKTDDLFYKIGVIVYMIGWMITMHYERKLAKAISAYMATIKVLEILGIIDPRQPPGVKNKKKHIQAFVDLVKSWTAQKKEAQEEVYQPA